MEGEFFPTESTPSVDRDDGRPQDEAFSIWSEWASFYRPGSEERGALESVKNERWLVSIVHHDYQNPQALWTFLFEE